MHEKKEIMAPLASQFRDVLYYDGKTNKPDGIPGIQRHLRTIEENLRMNENLFTKDKAYESLGFWQKVGRLLMRLGNPLYDGTALFSTRSRKFHEKAKSMLPGQDVEQSIPFSM